MNERIKELAEQAGSTHKTSLGVYQFYADELEKFAESIIEETHQVIVVGGVDDLDDVMKHFGIEE
jgi:hypothetical protein